MRVSMALAILASLAACGGSGGDGAASTRVIKSLGSLQCSGGGVTLAALQGQLSAANVKVSAAACGTDGLAQSTVCGSPDGKIGIFDIPAEQAGAAAAAGFVAITTLPTAKAVPCA